MENFTQFELLNQTIDDIGKLPLSPAGKLVYLYLIRCSNPNNKNVVFPAIQTISNYVGASNRTVLRSISELENLNLITKSKFNGTNQNAYFIKSIDNFTAEKVLLKEEGETEKTVLGQNVTSNSDKLSPSNVTKCHILYRNKKRNKKLNKHQQSITQSNSFRDDDFLEKSFRKEHTHVFLNDVPEHIRENKNIKNPCAYWASLDEGAKLYQLEYAKELEQKRLRKEEFKQKQLEEEKRLAEERKKEEELRNTPVEKQFSREEAIRQIQSMDFLGKEGRRKSYLVNVLLEEHNLNLDEVMGWT